MSSRAASPPPRRPRTRSSTSCPRRLASAWSRSRARRTRSSPRPTDHLASRRAIDSQTACGATATGDALSVALNLLQQGKTRTTGAPRSCCCPTAPPMRARTRSRWRSSAREGEHLDLHRGARHVVGLAAQPGSVRPAGRGSARPSAHAADRPRVARTLVHRPGRRRAASRSTRASAPSWAASPSRRDITVAFAAAALALLLVAGVGSLRWSGRLP